MKTLGQIYWGGRGDGRVAKNRHVRGSQAGLPAVKKRFNLSDNDGKKKNDSKHRYLPKKGHRKKMLFGIWEMNQSQHREGRTRGSMS